MKNITNITDMQKCARCNVKGFFCYTLEGADYYFCPCCGSFDFLRSTTSTDYDFLIFNENDEYNDDIRVKYYYCEYCRIIYGLGRIHTTIGCTDDIYNGRFIKKWRCKISNTIYEGMPQFDDVNDWFNNATNIEILEMFCPNNDSRCVNY